MRIFRGGTACTDASYIGVRKKREDGMERELLRLSETPLHLEKTWESGGVPVLTAEVTLPRCG